MSLVSSSTLSDKSPLIRGLVCFLESLSLVTAIGSNCDLHVGLLKKNLFENLYAIQKSSAIVLK